MRDGHSYVSDQRAEYYSKFPHYLLGGKISFRAMALYVALDSFRNRATGLCFPGYIALAERSGLPKCRIARAIKELVEVGAVLVEREKNQSNHYRLVDIESSTQRVVEVSKVSPQSSTRRLVEARLGVSPRLDDTPSPEPDESNSDESNHQKIQEVAATPPPIATLEPAVKRESTHVQQIAVPIMRDWEAHNHVKASASMRGKIFGGVKVICRRWNVPTEWSADHIITAWRCFLEDHRGKDWKFTWFLEEENYEREWHHAAIKKWENSAGRAPAPARDPYGI